MTRMKVAKLLYLVDLEAVRSTGCLATDVRWQWLDYGPFSTALYEVEDDLVRSRLRAERSARASTGRRRIG